MDTKNDRIQKEIALQKVIQSELSQVKQNSKVYCKQQNSDIFFLSSVGEEMSKSKRTLDALQQEHKEMEATK